MSDFSIYSLESQLINDMSYDLIKSQYINVFNNTLMLMGYIDYTDVLNLKYGPSENYTLNVRSLIVLFFELLNDENVGLKCLDDSKLSNFIITFGVIIDNSLSRLDQSKKLMCNYLINWYITNKNNFQYPIDGIDYVDKNSEDLSYIISSSYTITYS